MSTDDTTAGQAAPFTGRTAWARNLETPLRSFLRTETGSAAVLLAAAVAALVWATVDAGSYDRVWATTLSIRIGGTSVAHDLRYWLNSGLMTFFFFVVGLEARREFDMGELRERRRVALPLAAGIGGMVVPVAIFLAFNAGSSSAHGWGVAMSTDTAFALGMLALVGPRFPARLRAFMLTVCVVDDLVALLVIAIVYSSGVRALALLVAAAFFIAFVLVARFGLQRGGVVALLGVGGWVALSKSGVDPIVIGLAMGLLTFAAPAARGDLERASELFRLFREQPTPELARSARLGLSSALSPNERLQQLFGCTSSSGSSSPSAIAICTSTRSTPTAQRTRSAIWPPGIRAAHSTTSTRPSGWAISCGKPIPVRRPSACTTCCATRSDSSSCSPYAVAG
jgi:Na+/H+ antiporter 1